MFRGKRWSSACEIAILCTCGQGWRRARTRADSVAGAAALAGAVMGHGTGRRQRALGRPVAVGMHSAEFPEARSSPGRMAPVIRGLRRAGRRCCGFSLYRTLGMLRSTTGGTTDTGLARKPVLWVDIRRGHGTMRRRVQDGAFVYRFRTRPSQGRKTGSIPVRAAKLFRAR